MIRLLAVASCLAVAVPAVANPPPQIDRSRGIAPNNEDGPTERSPSAAAESPAPEQEAGASAPAIDLLGSGSGQTVPLSAAELDMLTPEARQAYQQATLGQLAPGPIREATQEARQAVASRLGFLAPEGQQSPRDYYLNLPDADKVALPATAFQACADPASSVLGSASALGQLQAATGGQRGEFAIRTPQGCLQALQGARGAALAGTAPAPDAPAKSAAEVAASANQQPGAQINANLTKAPDAPPPASPVQVRPTSRLMSGAFGAFFGGVAGVIANGAGAAAFLGVPPLAVIAVAAVAFAALFGFLGGGRRRSS